MTTNSISPLLENQTNFQEYNGLPDKKFAVRLKAEKLPQICHLWSQSPQTLRSLLRRVDLSREFQHRKTTLPLKSSRSWSLFYKTWTRGRLRRVQRREKMSNFKSWLSRIDRSWRTRNRKTIIGWVLRIVSRKRKLNERAKQSKIMEKMTTASTKRKWRNIGRVLMKTNIYRGKKIY